MTLSRAYVVGPALVPSDPSIAGVPLFLRTLLHLQSAGIREVFLHRCEGPSDDPRLEKMSIAASDSEAKPKGPALVIPLGTVWHPNVGKRLAQYAPAAEEVIAIGNDGAALYAVGDAALAPFLETMKTDVAREPVHAPEFVMVPKPGSSEAQKLLFRSLIKPTDGFVSRHLNRKVSMAVTRMLLGTSVTPNQMTIAALFFGIAGVIVAWPGGYWNVVIATLLVQTQSILDGCDGEIARLKHVFSPVGEWLDQVFDDVVNIAYLVAIGHALSIGHSAFFGNGFARFAWPVAMTTLVLHSLYQIGLYAALWTKGGKRGSVTAIRWKGQGPPKAPPETASGKRWYAIKKLFEDAGRRDFFTFFYVPCAILGCVEFAFVWHALIASLSGIATTSQWLLLGGPESADT